MSQSRSPIGALVCALGGPCFCWWSRGIVVTVYCGLSPYCGFYCGHPRIEHHQCEGGGLGERRGHSCQCVPGMANIKHLLKTFQAREAGAKISTK